MSKKVTYGRILRAASRCLTPFTSLDGIPYNPAVESPYTCNAIQCANREVGLGWGFYKVRAFAERVLQEYTPSCTQGALWDEWYSDEWTFEQLQGCRFMWLLFLAHLADDEKLSFTLPLEESNNANE